MIIDLYRRLAQPGEAEWPRWQNRDLATGHIFFVFSFSASFLFYGSVQYLCIHKYTYIQYTYIYMILIAHCREAEKSLR